MTLPGAYVFFVGTFFPAGFCVAFTVTFLSAVFAVTAFFAGAFFAAGFVAAAFFAATFLAEAFLPATFALPASAEPTSAPAIKNFERSLAAASHVGAGPRPLQVAPVLGSRYFAGCGPLRCPLSTTAPATVAAFLTTVFALLTVSTLAARVASTLLEIRNLLRSFTSAIQA